MSFVGSSEEQEKHTQLIAGPDWFEFQGSNDVGPSVIGFEPWLEKPAGKHGGVQMKGSQFVFEDGTRLAQVVGGFQGPVVLVSHGNNAWTERVIREA